MSKLEMAKICCGAEISRVAFVEINVSYNVKARRYRPWICIGFFTPITILG